MTAPQRIAGLRRFLLAIPVALAIAPTPAAIAAGDGAVGHSYGPGPCHCAWCRLPYCTDSCLYGYQDYAFGRGPLINLGSGSLQPGFRGYGVLGSPGYGQGLAPATRIDRLPPFYRWKHGRRHP